MGVTNLITMCNNLSDVAIVSVKEVDHRCFTFDISKSEKYNLLENSVLDNLGQSKKIMNKKYFIR